MICRKCNVCKRLLQVESFPRKNENKDWLGEERQYVPREEVCSECKSKEVSSKRASLSVRQKLKPHVSRCFKRSSRRKNSVMNYSSHPLLPELTSSSHPPSVMKLTNPAVEGITLEALYTKYNEQEGKCLHCKCVMEFETKGMGWNLCMEDREALGVWPSTDNLITVDRTDASDPSLPYVNKDTGEQNFSFLCFSCNREKYYEEDAAQKLANRNSLLLQRIKELEEELNKCRKVMKMTCMNILNDVKINHHSQNRGNKKENDSHQNYNRDQLTLSAGVEPLFVQQIQSLMSEKSNLENRIRNFQKLARNNFTQKLTIRNETIDQPSSLLLTTASTTTLKDLSPVSTQQQQKNKIPLLHIAINLSNQITAKTN